MALIIYIKNCEPPIFHVLIFFTTSQWHHREISPHSAPLRILTDISLKISKHKIVQYPCSNASIWILKFRCTSKVLLYHATVLQFWVTIFKPNFPAPFFHHFFSGIGIHKSCGHVNMINQPRGKTSSLLLSDSGSFRADVRSC